MKKKFGISVFRSGQLEAIDAAIGGKDVLCFMPTGYGKSICYQMPALMSYGITLVISPLISLMENQVSELKKLSIQAVAIHADANREHVLEMLSKSTTRLVYVSPERLSHKAFIDFISQRKIVRIVVDEAHCISSWGDGFRPEYKNICKFKHILENSQNESIPVSAFTATANYRVIADIIKYTGINSKDAFFFKGEVLRGNITLNMRCSEEKVEDLVRYLHTHAHEPTVVYVNTIKDLSKLSEILASKCFVHEVFHSKLEAGRKTEVLEGFIENKVSLIIATSAFGMGINKANIRHVVHYNVPESVEMYYQQIGRAGRDGKQSFALLLFNKKDKSLNRFMTLLSYPKYDHVVAVLSTMSLLSDDNLLDIERSKLLSSLPLDISMAELNGVLSLLFSKSLIKDYSDFNSPYLRVEIESDNTAITPESIEVPRKKAYEAFDEMFSIASSKICRSYLISGYFSSKEIEYFECGQCDNCIKKSSQGMILDSHFLNKFKKTLSKKAFLTKHEVIYHWMGIRAVSEEPEQFGIFEGNAMSWSDYVFNTLVFLGFLVSFCDLFVLNKHAFKNKSLINRFVFIVQNKIDCVPITSSLPYINLMEKRESMARESGVNPNLIMTHKQMVEVVTKEDFCESDLKAMIGEENLG